METRKVRQNGTDKEVTIHICTLDELDASAIRQGDEINVIMLDPDTKIDDLDWEMVGLMYGPMEEGETLTLAPDTLSWPKLLTELRCFPSASQAAKDWKSRKRELQIEKGFQIFTIGKARKITLAVWRPFREPLEEQPTAAP